VSKKPLFGIVADDLTGAMDSSGAMATHGLSAEVLPHGGDVLSQISADVICINTQSRLLPETQARQAVVTATARLLLFGCDRLYKKLDSTLRGNVGVELAAMMSASGVEHAFVCPAFPEMGRTVRDGILEVDGLSLTVTREGNDPFSGVGEASVVRLLQMQTEHSVGHVPIDLVDQGPNAVLAGVESLLAAGNTLFALDAVSPEHMITLASVLRDFYPNDLVAGSAGLASTLAMATSHVQADTVGEPLTRSAGDFLVISGSLHPASYEQLKRLSEAANVALLPIETAAILQNSKAGQETAASTVLEALRHFANRKHVVLFEESPESIQSLLDLMQDASSTFDPIQAIANFYHHVLTGLLDQPILSGLVVIGGETAHMVTKAIGAKSIRVFGDVRSGIPVGRLKGGAADGNLLVTKAGGFGAPSALAEVIDYLEDVPQTEA